ncbi:unnamed protein product [Diamesa serratosioi]
MAIVSPTLLAFGILFFCLLCYFKNYKKIHLNIPSPNSLPIIGHAHRMIGLNNEEQLDIITRLSHLYPNLVKVWVFHVMAILVNSPEMIQKVFNSELCMEKPYIAYKLLNLDFGLLASRYPRWKHDRKFFNNSFKINILQSFIPIFTTSANQLVNDLTKNLDGNAFNILDSTIRCTLKMICSTSLGMDLSDPNNEPDFDSVFHAVEYCTESVASLQNKPVVYPETFYKLTKRYRKHKIAEDYLMNFHKKIIDERRDLLKKNNNNMEGKEKKNIDSDDGQETPSYSIFIDHIINNEGIFTDKEVKDHVITVLSAGYETSATALAHCLLFLALHNDIQDKLLDEINEFFPTEDTEINYESLSKLQYMDRVLKESLRLAPVGPVIFRENSEDYEITPGVVVPKNTIFILNIYALHRSKAIWGGDADKFNPDNFLPENIAKRHSCSYIPYSTGRRNCIGSRYATISMKIILLQLLRVYKFSSDLKYDNLKFKAVLTLQLSGEHLVKIERRTQLIS